MRKMRLELENLTVDSFDTTPVRIERGTVVGHGAETFENSCMSCHTICDCPPSSATDVTGCGTCGASCWECESNGRATCGCGTGVTACIYTCYPDPC